VPRKYRLIARLIEIVRQARNIGWQRNASARIDDGVDVAIELQPNEIGTTFEHGDAISRRLERDTPTDSQRLADSRVTQRGAFGFDPFDEELRYTARVFVPQQTRTNHARIVYDQQIAGRERVGQLDEASMLDAINERIEDQQPAVGAMRQWRLRD